jgi:hypothetical protein
MNALRLLAHLDWGAPGAPAKRQLALATREGAGSCWRLGPVRQLDAVCAPQELGEVLAPLVGQGVGLIGLDMVLGVPAAWAARAGVDSFRGLLAEAGQGRWASLWEVARSVQEVSLERPFFPRRATRGVTQQELIDALGLPDAAALRRRCDLPRVGAPTPCPLFWTVGANQVGKGALAGWRELVAPALARPGASLWPFDGALDALLGEPGALVFAEVYPADAAVWLGVAGALRAGGGKRVQAARQHIGGLLSAWLTARGHGMDDALCAQLEQGFGEGGAGEDALDALLGLCGLLLHVDGERNVWEPTSQREVEGWIFGREV